jgi:hypothetical protein
MTVEEIRDTDTLPIASPFEDRLGAEGCTDVVVPGDPRLASLKHR